MEGVTRAPQKSLATITFLIGEPAKMLIVLIVFTVMGLAFIATTLFVSRLLRPSNPTPVKLEAYECGPQPFSSAWRQMNFHYYTFPLLFVLFDVESAFLFPVAVIASSMLKGMQVVVFVEILVFVAILVAGWFYAWRVGGLEWE